MPPRSARSARNWFFSDSLPEVPTQFPEVPTMPAVMQAIGVSPGAAFGSAKRWLPERFAEAANRVAHEIGASVAVFGSSAERELCASVTAAITRPVRNFAGETSLAEFIDMAAACRIYLTNDSGAMHIASALVLQMESEAPLPFATPTRDNARPPIEPV